MKLIVNGDDYCLTSGVSKGILKAINEGILTDTTVMTNTPYFDECMQMAKENGITEMGVHLTLTSGKALSNKEDVYSIVDKNGNFYKSPKTIPTNFNIDHVEKEFRAQINKFLSISQMRLNHIDAHHHIYAFDNKILNLVARLAKELGVPMRCPYDNLLAKLKKQGVKTPDKQVTSFYGQDVSYKSLLKVLKDNKDNNIILEIMTHPAIVDDELIKKSSYNKMREKELKILTSKEIKDYINENNIELINYSGVD